MSSVILGPPDEPRNVSILANSISSITVGWQAGLDGGLEQHFNVLHREKGQKNYTENSNNFPGAKAGQSMNYTIHKLDPNKKYEISIVAVNKLRGKFIPEAPMLTGSTKGKI